MSRKILVVFFVFCFLFSPVSFAGQKDDASEIKISTSKVTLDNGMTVLVSEMPCTSTVGIYALVKVGLTTEGKYLGTGISHFLEHMIFKGTEKRLVGQIGKEVKALGGYVNASTGLDRTVYLINIPKENFDQGLDVLSDMLMNARIDAKEAEKEKKVVLNEIRLHNDNPLRKLSSLIFKNVYVRHPYQHPVIGYEELFKSISQENLMDYYKTHYIPNNMIFAVAGNIKKEEVLPKIEEVFKDFKPSPYLLRNVPQEPEQNSFRHYEQEYPTNKTRFSMAYQTVDILDKDLYALDVLAMVLGQGNSSRFYKKIYSDLRLVDGISASSFTPMDKGVFEVEATLDRENLEATVDAVKSVISAVKKKGVTAKELAKSKKRVISHNIFDNQTPGQVAYRVVTDEAYTGDYDFSKAYIRGIKSVTSKDIKAVARKYLNDSNLTLVVLKPKSDNADSESSKKIEPSTEVQKVVLDNGLTILLREDHALPLIAVKLALHGGTRRETSEKNGLSQLMVGLWVRETKSKSPLVLAETVESMGASFGGFSGRNSFGITFFLLSEDLDKGLNIFEDVVKNPLFSRVEFDRDKKQTKESIIAREDDVYFLASNELRETLFLKHHFRLDTAGTLESVENIELSDVVSFHKEYVVPNNMVLSIFGDFSKPEMLNLLKKKFASLEPGELDSISFAEDIPKETREKTIYSDKNQAVLMIGFQGPTMKDDDRQGMHIATSVLGSSLSGRMFNKIRDTFGQSYTLGAGHTPGIDTGLVEFYVGTSAEDIDKVEEVLLAEIRDIAENGVTEGELSDSKAYSKGRYKTQLDTSAAFSALVTFDELYGFGHDYYKGYDQRIDEVTNEDVKRVVQKYLNISNAVVIKLLPQKEE